MNQPVKQEEYFLLYWVVNKDLNCSELIFGGRQFYFLSPPKWSGGVYQNFYVYMIPPKQSNIFRAFHIRL